MENISYKWFIIGVITFFIMGGAIGATITDSIYSKLLGQRDTELREHIELRKQIESDYNALRSTTDAITADNKRWADLNKRASEEVTAIGTTISQLQLQGKDIIEQLRRVIDALKEISRRIRVLENYYNNSGISSGN